MSGASSANTPARTGITLPGAKPAVTATKPATTSTVTTPKVNITPSGPSFTTSSGVVINSSTMPQIAQDVMSGKQNIQSLVKELTGPMMDSLNATQGAQLELIKSLELNTAMINEIKGGLAGVSPEAWTKAGGSMDIKGNAKNKADFDAIMKLATKYLSPDEIKTVMPSYAGAATTKVKAAELSALSDKVLQKAESQISVNQNVLLRAQQVTSTLNSLSQLISSLLSSVANMCRDIIGKMDR